MGSWFESNASKKYSWFAELFARPTIDFYNSFAMDISVGQNMRFNDKLSLSLRISYQPRYNNMGYTYVEGSNDINFAKRKVNTIEHVLSAKYSFSNRMGITFRARHYYTDDVENAYFKNLGNTLGADNNNNLSLKVIYFLDYFSFKNHISKPQKSF